ncbi:hypothetical protein [Legionella pneumophila]|uniref:Uncharacterized protein n=1 Tax=Legionella pneumophila subsp. pascullei TaxID=91890 RepID=A0AAX2IXQ3_LEGPN|nr:hypothetical protein [Legionella pneumophila]AMP89553.1 hypothetical protein AXF35_07640 [Legionella pneumophila subsp. pascullei]AMP92781.1 hypothetical protein AXF36_09160 [Legionella pneumophila subsp. pascullei]AMP95747.1 hypothetical protein AXF37_09050 [Legionella pneumophila subsp. pascullei]SQG90660.1 Uncharacterised protein [Legionella pneumophila subsp. pascullei]VEH07205.1 Uncharacterised protein [Legionella pneumophila subsp. pascullei]
MNRLAMIAAASCLALFLTGCGESSKPADTKTDQQQQQQPTDQQQQGGENTGNNQAQPSTEGQGQ